MSSKPKKDLLLPTSPIGQEFCQYFNCGKYFIYQVKDRWYTETRFPLVCRTLWRRHQDPSQVIGIRFNNQTNFFVIDLDTESEYHYKYDPLAFWELTESLEKIGIAELVKLQSSHSGGIHLFGFLPQKMNTFKLACALEKCLTTSGFKIKPGQLEIFPNPKPYNQPGTKSCGYNGIRLPLQPGTGSKLYNARMRLVNGGIKKLLKLANKTKKEQNMAILKRYGNQAVKWHKKQTTSYQEQRRQNYLADIEALAFSGWNGHNQTNEILKSLTNYGWVVQELRSEQELAAYIATTAPNLPGYEQYCRHKHEIMLRAKHWAASGCRYWAHKFNYPARNGKTYSELINEVNQGINAEIAANKAHPCYSYINQKRQKEFRARLQRCIAAIGFRNLPIKVKDCLELLQTKCQELFGLKFSIKTLKKPENRIHWHYKYRPQISPPAPFVLLKAIAIQAQLIKQKISKTLNYVTCIKQTQKKTKKSVHKKTPQADVAQQLKNSEKTTTNPSITIVSQKNPTMKCFGLFEGFPLPLWLWGGRKLLMHYKNELKKVDQITAKLVSGGNIGFVRPSAACS